MTRAHIVPGLAPTSLVSIKILCDAGCEVNYNGKECFVYYKNKLVWKRRREVLTKLWVLPLSPTTKPEHMPFRQPALHHQEYAANTYQMTSKAALIKYLHQCLFCPPKRTLLKAINNNQLTTWLGLTTAAVEEYLPDHAPSTDKGHMRRQRKGIRSTREEAAKALFAIETERDFCPPMEKGKNESTFLLRGHD